MDRKDTFNMRNPAPEEVAEMYSRAQKLREAKIKYKVLSQILDSKKEIDITISPEIFEALNRERMEFEDILKLHPEQAKDAMEQAEEDRQSFKKNTYWNPKSEGKWGCMGHIPPCIYYSRPPEYWKDRNLLRNFFNLYPKFRVSTKRI